MFQAKVILGDFVEYQSDSSLKMPPLKEGKLHYDSVKGEQGGDQIFVVYANKKAYPEYLITYQE